MPVMSKVTVEFRFKKKVSRRELENFVVHLGQIKHALVTSEIQRTVDPDDISIKVWFDEFHSIMDANPFMKILKKGGS
jgi:hypothetical protein